MSLYTHQIDKERHQFFLNQNRLDPVTGERICAGDKVVFCASCGSTFLEETWQYLEKIHCGQKLTLDFIPHKDNFLFRKKKNQMLFYQFMSQSKWTTSILLVLSVLAAFFSLWALTFALLLALGLVILYDFQNRVFFYADRFEVAKLGQPKSLYPYPLLQKVAFSFSKNNLKTIILTLYFSKGISMQYKLPVAYRKNPSKTFVIIAKLQAYAPVYVSGLKESYKKSLHKYRFSNVTVL